ncbi:hypothetical protein Pelo_8019 [Pelomyxa schiedti]|nr:hypothetical protein Pelo_8019 [Pelomyxa schiedti]
MLDMQNRSSDHPKLFMVNIILNEEYIPNVLHSVCAYGLATKLRKGALRNTVVRLPSWKLTASHDVIAIMARTYLWHSNMEILAALKNSIGIAEINVNSIGIAQPERSGHQARIYELIFISSGGTRIFCMKRHLEAWEMLKRQQGNQGKEATICIYSPSMEIAQNSIVFKSDLFLELEEISEKLNIPILAKNMKLSNESTARNLALALGPP